MHIPQTEQFINYLRLQKRFSVHTAIAYQTDLTAFFDFLQKEELGALQLSEITPFFIRNWLASLKQEKQSAKTINRKISTLKSFFRFQLRQGSITVSPMTTIGSAKVGKRLPQYVEEQQMDTLFRQVEFPDNWEGRTHRLVLQLLYHTGMRRAELTGLTESRVDAGNCSIRVIGKGNKERIIPVSSELMQALTGYMADKKSKLTDYESVVLLVNGKGKKLHDKYVYNVVTHYLGLVTTLDKKSPHVLRHTFATHLTSNGAELNAVKELLGHSSLAATQIYTHNTIARLKEAHQKAHPKG